MPPKKAPEPEPEPEPVTPPLMQTSDAWNMKNAALSVPAFLPTDKGNDFTRLTTRTDEPTAFTPSPFSGSQLNFAAMLLSDEKEGLVKRQSNLEAKPFVDEVRRRAARLACEICSSYSILRLVLDHPFSKQWEFLKSA